MARSGGPESTDPRARYRLRLSCPHCGDIVVAAEQCSLLQRADGAFVLAYRCSQCNRPTRTTMAFEQVQLLIDRGFVVRRASTPPAAALHPSAPSFTEQDVRDAAQLLASTDFVVSLLTRDGSTDPADRER